MPLIQLNDGKNFVKYEIRTGNTVEILDIAVNTERGKGTGTKLIKAMLDNLESGRFLYAFVRRSNVGALIFYKKVGFEYSTIVPSFYVNDAGDKREDAVLVGKFLKGKVKDV